MVTGYLTTFCKKGIQQSFLSTYEIELNKSKGVKNNNSYLINDLLDLLKDTTLQVVLIIEVYLPVYYVLVLN